MSILERVARGVLSYNWKATRGVLSYNWKANRAGHRGLYNVGRDVVRSAGMISSAYGVTGAARLVKNYGANKLKTGGFRPEMAAIKGILGGLAGLAIVGGPVYAATSEYDRASRQGRQGREGADMARMLSRAQEGPFGTGARPYQGMGANNSGAAGMTLALHYARNGSGMKSYM